MIRLLFLTSLCAAQTVSTNPPSCLSLTGSKSCPSFQQFALDRTKSFFTTLPTDFDVPGFDAFVNAQGSRNLNIDCPEWVNAAPVVRYGTSLRCTSFSLSPECDRETPRLCKSTCLAFAKHFEQMTREICKLNIQTAMAPVLRWFSECENNVLLNSTSNCIDGNANEPSHCGFQSAEQACKYCDAKDTCCKALACTNLSGEAPPKAKKSDNTYLLIGITVGGLIGLLMILSIVYFTRRKGKQAKLAVAGKRKSVIKVPSAQVSDASKDNPRELRISISTKSNFSTELANRKSRMSSAESSTMLEPILRVQNLDRKSLDGKFGIPDGAERYEGTVQYEPALADEIAIEVGDVILLTRAFDDGWAIGINTRTSMEGVFPLASSKKKESNE